MCGRRNGFTTRGARNIYSSGHRRSAMRGGKNRGYGVAAHAIGRRFPLRKFLFEPPYSVIDGTLVEHGGTCFLFHKEEEFGAQKGERRAIRLATSSSPDGPYSIVEGPLNDGQIVPIITEGPSVLPDPSGEGWLLLYDFCMADGYGVSHSNDLLNWRELSEGEVSFPIGARHGAAFEVSAEELAALQKAFATS